MNKFFHSFLINFVLLSSSQTFNARVIDPFALDKINYNIEEAQLKNLLATRKRNLVSAEYPGEESSDKIHLKGKSPAGYFRGLRKSFGSISQKHPNVNDDIGVKISNPNEEIRISSHAYNEKLSPESVIEWIENIAPGKWKQDAQEKRRKRFQSGCLRFGQAKRYLDYTNSQMPFNEGQKHQQKKMKAAQFTDRPGRNEKACRNDLEDPFDLGLENKILRRRMSLPLRSQERNFEMLKGDSDSEYSRVRRYLDHKRVKKRSKMTSTLEAKEAAMSRVLDPNLNLDGILEPHVRKRRGKRKSFY